jgi:hypothetical protein
MKEKAMEAKKRVIMIGLGPDAVDYDRFPGLTPEKLVAQLKADEAALNALGYDAQQFFIDRGETAEAVVTKKLTESKFDCVVIGAGVRNNPDHILLFEKLVNVVHQYAPSAKIAFNTKASDTAEAVRRWV